MRVDKVIAECKIALNSIKCHDTGNMLHTSPNSDNPVLKELKKKPGFVFFTLVTILNNFDEGRYQTTSMLAQDVTTLDKYYRLLLAFDQAKVDLINGSKQLFDTGVHMLAVS